MPERDEDLRSELARVVARMLEIQQQLLKPEPPAEPEPPPRPWTPRILKGGLAGVAALAPVAFVRNNWQYAMAGLTVAAGILFAAVADQPDEPPPRPSIALPSPNIDPPRYPAPTPERPRLEPRPGPPTEDAERDVGPGVSAPETPDATDAPVQVTQPSPEPEQPDTEPPPPRRPEPRDEQPRDEQPREPECSIVHVDLGPTLEACLLPE